MEAGSPAGAAVSFKERARRRPLQSDANKCHFFFLRFVCPAHLDGVVVAVVREALGAERAVHAVQAVHVALALVRVRVHLALTEEARRQQRLQPRRPPLVLSPVAPASFLPHSIQQRRH
jgi:hypothetical protein